MKTPSGLSLLVAALLLGGAQQQVFATSYTYGATTGSISSPTNWTTSANWNSGAGPAPASDLDNVLSFTLPGGAHMVTTNDLGTFQLNALTLTNNSSSTNGKQLSIAGNALNFVKNSSNVLPTLVLSRASATSDSGTRIIISAPITVTDALTITNSVKSGSVTISGNITNAAGMTFNGSVTNGITVGSNVSPFGAISGTGGITINGSYNVSLIGNNTYTGLTDVRSGTLTLNRSGGTLANTAAVQVSGGTLNVAQSDTVGAVTLSSGTISGAGTLTGSSYSLTNSGAVSAILGGSGVALTKSGEGTATLSAASTYTGATTVSAGTLILDVANAVSSSSNVVLGGGTLQSAFSQTLGTLSLALGTVNVLDLSTGGTFVFADSSLATWGSGGTLSIIGTFTDHASVHFGVGGLTVGQLSRITINGSAATIDDSGYLAIAIPEPSTYAMLAGVLTLGTVVWRRTHRRTVA